MTVPGRWEVVIFRVVPGAIIVGLVLVMVRGPGGVLDFFELQRTAEASKAAWTDAEQRNNETVLALQQLTQDPVQLERLIADELGQVRPGTVLYRFDEQGGPAVPPPATP